MPLAWVHPGAPPATSGSSSFESPQLHCHLILCVSWFRAVGGGSHQAWLVLSNRPSHWQGCGSAARRADALCIRGQPCAKKKKTLSPLRFTSPFPPQAARGQALFTSHPGLLSAESVSCTEPGVKPWFCRERFSFSQPLPNSLVLHLPISTV